MTTYPSNPTHWDLSDLDEFELPDLGELDELDEQEFESGYPFHSCDDE